MKNNTFKKILACAVVLTAASPAIADELNQTISLEKEKEAVEHKAEKKQYLPEPAAVSVRQVDLNFSNWTIPAALSPSLVTQQPQPYNDGFLFSKKRGYAEFGMGNYLNINGSAGYRILDKKKTQLAVWLQHNSTDGTIADSRKSVVEDRVGVNFRQAVAFGTISADAGYHFDKFNYYGRSPQLPDDKQKVNEASVRLALESNAGKPSGVNYHASVGYNYFGNAMTIGVAAPATGPEKPITENHLSVAAGAEVVWGEGSHIGIDLDFNHVGYRHRTTYDYNGPQVLPAEYGNDRHSVTSLTPYYRKMSDKLNLLLGARIDIATSGTTFRIAPEVALSYLLSQKLSVELTATGGNRINAVHDIAARNRYLNPTMSLPKTYTPVDAELRMNIGLWKGFSASPFIGFAQVKSALMPVLLLSETAGGIQPASFDLPAGTTHYAGQDRSGIKAGIDLSYRFKDLFELSAGYVYTPQDVDSGYILDDDRAEHSISASLKVTPFRQLDIYANYLFRSGRNVLAVTRYEDATLFPTYAAESLGIVSDLGIGANYRINDLIHVYAQGNNLLNRSWQNYYGMKVQKANFIVGVGVTF